MSLVLAYKFVAVVVTIIKIKFVLPMLLSFFQDSPALSPWSFKEASIPYATCVVHLCLPATRSCTLMPRPSYK